MKRSLAVLSLTLSLNLLVPLLPAQAIQSGHSATVNSTTFDHMLLATAIPRVMHMGKSYPVRILIKNNGPRPKRLRVILHSPGRFIYPDYDSEIFTIGARNIHVASFELTPIRPHIGVMNVTVYLVEGESPEYLPTDFTILDSATVFVTRIDPYLSAGQKAVLFITLLLGGGIVAYLLYRRSHPPQGRSLPFDTVRPKP